MALLGLCALALPAAVGGMLSHGHRQEMGLTLQRRGDLGGNATAPIDDILKRGEWMTQEAWLEAGAEALVALKKKVFKLDEFKSRVQSQCPVAVGDCSFNRGARLFCESLESAAAQEKLGDIPTLEKLLSATTASTRFYGVDTTTQSALIARWAGEEQWPAGAAAGRAASSAFGGLRQRVLDSEDFQGLVKDTCLELSSVRPGCQSKASDGVFCEALGQSAAVLLGAAEASRRIGEVLR